MKLPVCNLTKTPLTYKWRGLRNCCHFSSKCTKEITEEEESENKVVVLVSSSQTLRAGQL